MLSSNPLSSSCGFKRDKDSSKSKNAVLPDMEAASVVLPIPPGPYRTILWPEAVGIFPNCTRLAGGAVGAGGIGGDFVGIIYFIDLLIQDLI